jgi:prepilin signal peptidase PulO-like enzyme (type II secretory pathway)
MIGATLGPVNVFVVLMLASLFGSVGGMATIVWSWFAKHREHVLDRGAVFATQIEGEEGSLAARVAALACSGGVGRPRRSLHHLPFGPWITLAALLVLIFHRAAQAGLVSVFVPGSSPAGPHLFF